MSAQHKEALAEGRRLSRAVDRYLVAIETHKPKRGRQRTKETAQRQLTEVKAKLANGARAAEKLELIQRRIDLEQELARDVTVLDLSALEKEFVAAAKPYAAKNHITYGAFRECGVAPEVLKKAGVSRGMQS